MTSLAFFIKGFPNNFLPDIKHIFDVRLPEQYLSTPWKQAEIVPVSMKRQHCLC
jgi:hypothetical protein